MNKNENSLLQYFFIIGAGNESRQNLKNNKYIKEKPYITPEILSFYSIDGYTSLFNSIKNNLETNDDLRNNIFPMKADYLDLLLDPDFDESKIKDMKKIYSDYIIQTNSNSPPKYCYHCFQYELGLETGNDLILNFGVLIFYENINDIDLKENEKIKKNKTDSINIYLGKALVLVSDKIIFSLMKQILEKIYLDFIIYKYSVIPLEPFIINLINSINNNIYKIYFKNDNNEENNLIEYFPFKKSILPFCDLNLRYFFQIFDINDILLIAEYYFLTKSIIFISPNYELLYPIYHILMTLFYPLNFHLKYYFYKILYPELVITGLNSILPCFYFIYSDKNNNNGIIHENIIKKITEEKKEILIFHIIKDFDKEENKTKIVILKNIYLYDDENNFSKKPPETYIGKTLIENVMTNVFGNNEDNIYLTMIKSNINNILKCSLKTSKNDIYDIPLNLNIYDELRKNFLGLIIKFLVIKIEPLTFRLNDEKIEICPLTIQEKNVENKINEEENVKLKDFLEDSPQTELIYKNEIIKFNYFNIDYLRTQILLDYFIKISKNDPNTLSFDDNNFNDKGENQNKNKNSNEISFKELFDYKKFLKSKKNKVIELDQETEEEIKYYEIMNLSDLKKYISINEERIQKIFGNEISSVIFFNENFMLNFDKYVFVSYNLNLDNQNIFSFYNINDPIIINNKEDINKKNYYYLILYEAKIFKKIFYMINTNNRKERSACAIGLYLSLYLLHLLSQKSKNEEQDEVLIIKNLFEKLFTLFTQTKCFYGKFNFITTLIYFILIIYKPLKVEYFERFIYSLQELKNVPSLIIILLYNNNIEYNLFKNNNNSDFKEIKILFLEKIKHKHEFEIEKLSGEFICIDNECQEYMWFNVVNSITNKKETENVLNPIYLIEKLLNKIEENNSVIIPDIANTDDIQQVAFLDEIYFNIRFFRDNFMDELEY